MVHGRGGSVASLSQRLHPQWSFFSAISSSHTSFASLSQRLHPHRSPSPSHRCPNAYFPNVRGDTSSAYIELAKAPPLRSSARGGTTPCLHRARGGTTPAYFDLAESPPLRSLSSRRHHPSLHRARGDTTPAYTELAEAPPLFIEPAEAPPPLTSCSRRHLPCGHPVEA